MLIPQTVLNNLLSAGREQGADFCEIYAEESFSQLMELKSSQTEYLSGKDCGAGIRLLYGTEELYTHTNSLSETSLMKALRSLSAFKKARSGQSKGKKTAPQTSPPPAFSYKALLVFKKDLNKEKAFLQAMDRELRGQDSSVTQVYFSLRRKLKRVQTANSEGLFSYDIRPGFHFGSRVVTEKAGCKEYGSSSLGRSLKSFWNEGLLRLSALEAGHEALQNLNAGPVPAGRFPVIINKGFGGVIFHEACGHGMETTSVAENLSVFAGRLGQKIAPACVTAYDDGLLEGEYGSLAKDDEGLSAQKNLSD